MQAEYSGPSFTRRPNLKNRRARSLKRPASRGAPSPKLPENCGLSYLLSLSLPGAPVRWEHVQPLFGFCAYPASDDAAARENKLMRPVIVDDGELQIAVKRGEQDGLPHF